MLVTFNLYKNQLTKKPELVHCIKCTRPLFKVNSDALTISNVGSEQVPPSAHYTEHKCHSCATIYRVLFH